MKKMMIAIIVILCLMVIGMVGIMIINAYVKNLAKDKIKENTNEIQDADAIVILGCQVKEDGSLSLMLKDRLDKGIELYKNGVAPKIIVSGDHTRENYDEVNAMKNYLIENQIPSTDIFMDHAGIATYDTMYRAKNIFGVDKCIVVTQEYHLYRSIYIGEKLGMETYGFAAKKVNYVGQTGRDIREILARNKDFVKCIFKPKSKYLGETIPVSGNGDITNDKKYNK